LVLIGLLAGATAVMVAGVMVMRTRMVVAQKNLVPEGFINLKVFFVCSAGHASLMLSETPSFVGMMPCSWAVYEMADGSVWLAKMNVGLMSKMFSGVAGTMMRKVGQADDRFLAEVLG
jgi:uncharacterized protein (DUF302 family)